MTHITKVKCMNCSLHWAAYSFHPGWQPQHCPECCSTYPFMVWREETGDQIYELVPGHTELSEVGAGRKPVSRGASPVASEAGTPGPALSPL